MSEENQNNIIIGDCAVKCIEDVSLTRRIATCARVCYKSEVEPSDESDKKLIQNCIKQGHESVLEHGAMSVFLPVNITDDGNHIMTVLRDQKNTRVIFRNEYEAFPTIAMRRWSTEYYDIELGKNHLDDLEYNMKKDLPAGEHPMLPVVLADIRAWRRIVGERLYLSGGPMRDTLSFVITVAVLNALYKAEPVFFEDMYNRLNENLAATSVDTESKDPMIKEVFNKLPADNRTVDGFMKTFFPNNQNCIFAGEASKTAFVTFMVTANRSVTHQLVRHRQDVAYSQESQRWVNYDKKGMCVTQPIVDTAKITDDSKLNFVDKTTGKLNEDSDAYKAWKEAMENAYASYKKLLDLGLPPETARGVLPNDCQTTIAVTWLTPTGFTNFMHWRNEKHAQIQIRQIADQMLLQVLGKPYGNMIDPSLVLVWLKNIEDQKVLPDLTTEKLEEFRKYQTERINAITEYDKKRHEEMEKRQKEKEENERSGIKVQDTQTTHNPDYAPKGEINLCGHNNNPPQGDSDVQERPLTVDIEKIEVKDKE